MEELLLKNFKKKLKQPKIQNLIVLFNPDAWPDEEGTYWVEIAEREDNGKVWTCECTKSGNIKEYYEL